MRKLIALLTLVLGTTCPLYSVVHFRAKAAKVDEAAPIKFPEATSAKSDRLVLASLHTPEEQPTVEFATKSDREEPQDPVERMCRALAHAAHEHDLPKGFLARLIWQESRFDPKARSHAGAMGVAQFMPKTAAAFGLDDPHEPISSLAASARFLKQLRDQFGNLGLAAAAYNAGSGRVSKWLKGEQTLPSETRKYVKIITGSPASHWTARKEIDLHVALPESAPCDGIEGLSRELVHAPRPVKLSASASRLLEQADRSRRSRIGRKAKKKGRKVQLACARISTKQAARVVQKRAKCA